MGIDGKRSNVVYFNYFFINFLLFYFIIFFFFCFKEILLFVMVTVKMILLHLFQNLKHAESWMLCRGPCLGAGNWRSYRRGPRTCPVPRVPRVVPCVWGPAGCALCRRHDALPFAAVCHVTGSQGLSCLPCCQQPLLPNCVLVVSFKGLNCLPFSPVCPVVTFKGLSSLSSCQLYKFILSAQLSTSEVCPVARVHRNMICFPVSPAAVGIIKYDPRKKKKNPQKH